MTKPLMAGIDLHSNNLMIGIVDQSGKRLKHQKVACDLKEVLAVLAPFHAVEYNQFVIRMIKRKSLNIEQNTTRALNYCKVT